MALPMALPKCGPEWRGGGVLAKRREMKEGLLKKRTYIAIYIVATVTYIAPTATYIVPTAT